jgi:alpha-mannosidase
MRMGGVRRLMVASARGGKMTRRHTWIVALPLALLAASTAVRSQSQPPQKPVLYVIGTSHLDSQWNWTVQDSIRRFVPATFFENFDRFEKFPHYVFSYEGAIHYMWFKEYHPEAWATLQKYIAEGRWKIAGNWINAVDVNVPAPESLMRHALYAKQFFRREFNRVSEDVYLPDCFGFGFALPSIALHSGLKAFTTQKLTWGSSYGIPFPVGRWRGTDGGEVIAALNPGAYVTRIDSDIANDPKWSNDPTPLGDGKSVIYRLFGVGDVGGAPQPESIEWLEKSLANSNGAVEVRNTSVDQLARDLTAEERAALPVYEGELTMKTHGVGTHTSQAAMKRLNRENERLADAAERASVAADWLAGLPYPTSRLRESWIRVLWHHFHDDITGTSIPQAYQFSWNDELVSLNQFTGVLTSAVGSVASRLDTRVTAGSASLVVYNPVAETRRDVVDATITIPATATTVRVIDPSTGRDVPTQILERQGTRARVLFLADMPSVGFKVFEARFTAATAAAPAGALKVTANSLENARYSVRIDENGDIASVMDREAGHELLHAPARLEMRDDPSPDKPAWRILWETVSAPVREFVQAPTVRIVERGPVRVALEITRHAAGSTIVQRISLTDGGDRVDVDNDIDWRSTNTLLKAAFPMAASNPKATFDLGLGTISRGNANPDAYEVPAQWWADLTDTSGTFGTAVMSDSKYGWDKPADHVLRLTLLHTPKPGTWPRPFYQASQDLGRHIFRYAIAGHKGDWRDGTVPARAGQLNQPLQAFASTSHPGGLGRSVSLLAVDDPKHQVAVRAIKKAEDSDEIVVRVQELHGKPAHASLTFAGPIAAAREINAAEEPVGAAAASGGGLDVTLARYQPRTFAVKLAPAPARTTPPASVSIPLPFNLDGFSISGDRMNGFDGNGLTLAADLWPQTIDLDGVRFALGQTQPGAMNVVVPAGQILALPSTTDRRVFVLASAIGGDVPATFSFAGTAGAPTGSQTIQVREWQAPIGQWYSPLVDLRMLREPVIPAMTGQTWTEAAIRDGMVTRFDPATGAVSGIDQIRPAFVKRDEIAWIGTHRNGPSGKQIYIPSYVFLYRLDVPAGATTIRLPSDPHVRIFAVSVASQRERLTPSKVLYAWDFSER